jgi:hypothetical protein
MKAIFMCTKHDAPLEGFPLWRQIASEFEAPDFIRVYTESYENMWCPCDVDGLACQDDWTIRESS